MAAAMGIMLMFCTPPATTRSAVPLSTAWAAKCTACWEEPHWRSTVTPGTASGRPAASHAAEYDVVHGAGVGAGAGQQFLDDVRAEIGRVRAGQAAAAAGDRSAHGV